MSIGAYREQLGQVSANHLANSLRHEQIIHKLDERGQTFRILIVKKNWAIPYTSVFLQCDRKYWSADAEQRLRTRMPVQAPEAAK